jgi:hypothetical protein
VTYEIDLRQKNANKLRAAFEPWPTGDRGVMMPKRRHNDGLVAERNKPPPF